MMVALRNWIRQWPKIFMQQIELFALILRVWWENKRPHVHCRFKCYFNPLTLYQPFAI